MKKLNITIEDMLKIWMLNNPYSTLKTYLTVINNRPQKDMQLEENKVLFKRIEEEKTHITATSKVSVNFPTTKCYFKPQERVCCKKKKEFVD